MVNNLHQEPQTPPHLISSATVRCFLEKGGLTRKQWSVLPRSDVWQALMLLHLMMILPMPEKYQWRLDSAGSKVELEITVAEASGKWLFPVAHSVFVFTPPSRHNSAARNYWVGWSAHLTARRPL